MKGNQKLPSKQITSNNMSVKTVPFFIDLKATVEAPVTIQDTEVQTIYHIQTQNLITVIVILNYRVETVHHTQDPLIITTSLVITLKIHIQITLDHNHLIIIEMEIVHDDNSLVIDSVI